MISRYADAVSRRPWIVIALMVAVTVFLTAGAGLIEEDEAGLESFLSTDDGPGRALAILEERFPDSGRPRTIQVVVRGDVTDPDAITAVVEALNRAIDHPDVAPSLDRDEPVISYAHLITDLAIGTGSPITESAVELILAEDVASSDGRALLDDMIVTNSEGEVTAGVGFVTQQRTDLTAPELNAAAAALDDLLTEPDLPADITVSTFSQAQFEEAFEDGLADTQLVFPVALLLIVGVLWLFFRSVGDTVITLVGVIMTVA